MRLVTALVAMFGVGHQSGSLAGDYRIECLLAQCGNCSAGPCFLEWKNQLSNEFESGWETFLMELENMSVAKLKKLRAEVDATIATKLVERRQHLEAELSKLAQIVGERPGRNSKGGGKALR